MGSFKTYASLAGCLAIAASMSTARAADLLPPPPPMDEPMEFSTGGWYLRGDIGFSNQNVDRITNVAAVPGTIVIQKGFDSAPIGGIGVGYKFNNWLRADITGEYRGRSNLHGFDRYPDPFSNSGTGFGTNDYTGSKSEAVGLVNIYADLGTWYGLTPFIGGGVGVSYNTIHDFKDTNVPTLAVATARDKSETSFAWALHAGLGYAVTPNVTVEFAYRYLHLGDARTGTLIGYTGLFAAPETRFRDIDSHDFKVGVRWMLGGEQAYDHPPLMRKG